MGCAACFAYAFDLWIDLEFQLTNSSYVLVHERLYNVVLLQPLAAVTNGLS